MPSDKSECVQTNYIEQSLVHIKNCQGGPAKFGTLTMCIPPFHYSDVMMSAKTSQITSVTIVYSTVCSGTDQRKHQSSASLAFVREGNSPVTDEFPAQRASYMENVSI